MAVCTKTPNPPPSCPSVVIGADSSSPCVVSDLAVGIIVSEIQG